VCGYARPHPAPLPRGGTVAPFRKSDIVILLAAAHRFPDKLHEKLKALICRGAGEPFCLSRGERRGEDGRNIIFPVSPQPTSLHTDAIEIGPGAGRVSPRGATSEELQDFRLASAIRSLTKAAKGSPISRSHFPSFPFAPFLLFPLCNYPTSAIKRFSASSLLKPWRWRITLTPTTGGYV